MTLPAYARDVFRHRQSGLPIALLVWALHDWNAGKWFRGEPSVLRVVVPDDLPILDVDWSVATALDCLIVGLPDDDAMFYAAAKLLNAAGAASVWGAYPDGLWRLEPWAFPPGFVATAGPVAHENLLCQLTLWRHVGLMAGDGVYAQPMFREARVLAYAQIFGAEVADRLRARVGA